MAKFDGDIPEFIIALYSLMAVAASTGLAPDAPSTRPFLILHHSIKPISVWIQTSGFVGSNASFSQPSAFMSAFK